MTSTDEQVEQLADLAQQQGLRIGTAESLTSGAISSRLGAAPSASEWFAGGVVAYRPEVKFELLDVREGPLACTDCAEEMATGARRLLGVDVVVAATGVGGPEPSEGQPAGSVFLAVADASGVRSQERHLDGDPEEVIAATVAAAVELVWETVRG